MTEQGEPLRPFRVRLTRRSTQHFDMVVFAASPADAESRYNNNPRFHLTCGEVYKTPKTETASVTKVTEVTGP